MTTKKKTTKKREAGAKSMDLARARVCVCDGNIKIQARGEREKRREEEKRKKNREERNVNNEIRKAFNFGGVKKVLKYFLYIIF